MMDILDEIAADFQTEMTYAKQLNVAYKGLCGYCKKAITNDQHLQLEAPAGALQVLQPMYHHSCYENNVLPKCFYCKLPIHAGQILLPEAAEEQLARATDNKLTTVAVSEGEPTGSTTSATSTKVAPITTKPTLSAPRTCHPECFKCSSCNAAISNQTYFCAANGPTCIACYEETSLPTCDGCGKKIRTDVSSSRAEWLMIGQKRFHKGCFSCKTCKAPFDDLKAYVFDNDFFCKDHINAASGSKPK